MLKLIGICMLGIGFVLLLAAYLWHLFLRRHDAQRLPTAVMHAVHDLLGTVTASQVVLHLERTTGRREDLSEVRMLLECMEAEGTLRSERPQRRGNDDEWPAKVYILTPRFAAGHQ